MSGSTVSLIINLLLIVVLIACFFIGVVRGAKKQGVRSAYFVGFLIVFLLFSPLISSALMDLSVGPNGQSLSGFIESQITSNESVNQMVTANPAMQELIDKLPIVVINLAVVLVLTLLALFFSWIAYLITKHVHLNKYKREAKKMKDAPHAPNGKIYTVKDGKPVIIDRTEPKSKRYRWWGGLIGAVSGFVIMFALLLPITGVARTATAYIDFSASAEVVEEQKTDDDFEYQQISDMLKEMLGPDVVDILRGVNDSVFLKVTSIGDVDLALFDTISTVKVNGEKITLRNEVKAVADVTESVLYVEDAIPQTEEGEYDFANMDWQTLDFDKLEKAINSLFNSGILRSVVGDLIDNVFTDEFVDKNITRDLFDESISDDEFAEYKAYIKEVFKEIRVAYEKDEAKTIDQLKNDCLAILGVAKAIVNSGIANFLNDVDNYQYKTDASTGKTETEFDVIIDCLYGNSTLSKVAGHDYLQDITDNIFTSSTIKGLLVAGVNIGCDILKNEIKDMLAKQETPSTEEVQFSTVSQDNIDWDKVSSSFKSLLDNGIEIFQFLQDDVAPVMEDETLDENQKIKNIITSDNFKNCLTSVGEILDGIVNSPLFEIIVDDATQTTKSLVDEMLTELNKVEKINKYADLTELKNLDWGHECDIIADLIEFVVPIIDAENIEFSTLEYTKLQTAVDGIFDSAITKAIKTSWIKNEIGYSEFSVESQQVYDAIFTEDVKCVADLKDIVKPLINIFADAGKAGALDVVTVMCEKEEFFVSDVADKIDFMCTKLLAENSTLIKDILNNITANNKCKNLFVVIFNNFVVGEVEITEGDVGNIGLPENDQVWINAKTKIQTLTELLLRTIQNAEITGATEQNDIQNIVNALVASNNDTTMLEQIGVALDKLLECELFKNADNQSTLKNIIYNLLKDNEQFSYDKTDNFWAIETTNFVETLKILNNKVVSGRTMLDLIIKQDNNDLLLTGLKQLTNDELTKIATALHNTKLLASFKTTFESTLVDVVNEINQGVYDLLDGSDAPQVDSVSILTLPDVIKVANILKDLQDTEKTSLADIIADETASEILITLLETMKTGDNTEDYVFSTVYNKVFDYITTNYSALDSVADKTSQTIVWSEVITEINSLPKE